MILSWKDVLTISFILVTGTYKVSATDVDITKFPDNFLIGAATAAYQIEGAWNYADKGESIWDRLLHSNPSLVNGQNGDVACDSFHKYKEDVKALKTIGLTHYRFSVSWPRILPTGYANNISATGVKYYHNLIDELLANNIIPMLGTFAHPIFSKDGDWPQVVKDRVAKNSKDAGWPRSRLPAFTAEEIKLIKGTFDFFGLNHYTSRYITSGEEGADPSFSRDVGTIKSTDPSWKEAFSPWIKVVPWGFRAVLNHIKTEYGNPKVVITENGFSSDDEMEDTSKIQYHHDYLQEMLKAIHLDKCNVIGYTVWSLLDNFSWIGGYTKRFGLVHVDHNSPDRTRAIKKSGKYFQEIIKNKKLISI